MHILGTSFFAVVAVTERLPVALVPKQDWITTVWNNVVDVGRFDVPAFPQAFNTKWVRFQIQLPGSSPRTAVSSAGSAGPVALVLDSMFITVLRSVWD